MRRRADFGLTNSSLLHSPIIWADRHTCYFFNDQRVKTIEKQVTEAGASGSDLVSSAAPDNEIRTQFSKSEMGSDFFLPSHRKGLVCQGAEIPWNPREIVIQQNNHILHLGIFFH